MLSCVSGVCWALTCMSKTNKPFLTTTSTKLASPLLPTTTASHNLHLTIHNQQWQQPQQCDGVMPCHQPNQWAPAHLMMTIQHINSTPWTTKSDGSVACCMQQQPQWQWMTWLGSEGGASSAKRSATMSPFNSQNHDSNFLSSQMHTNPTSAIQQLWDQCWSLLLSYPTLKNTSTNCSLPHQVLLPVLYCAFPYGMHGMGDGFHMFFY